MTIPPFLYRHLVRPALFRLPPEAAHEFAMWWLRRLARRPALARRLAPPADPRLATTAFGVRFPNPVGLAAGFDKNAEALAAWPAFGFGFIEAGTITAHAQPGNPRPRVFRVPECGALINRMGFNNEGAAAVAARLAAARARGGWPAIPVGINLGKSRVVPVAAAVPDYLAALEALWAAADYLVLNVSSPNTPGLRQLQGREALDALVTAVQQRNRELAATAGRPPAAAGTPAAGGKPLLLKIAPDLELAQLDEIMALAAARGVGGIIATNTTLDHSALPPGRRTEGGLSGRPLRERATAIVRYLCRHAGLPVVASGGVMDADAALEKFDAGAALVQVYTGFIYRGPSLVPEILGRLRHRTTAR